MLREKIETKIEEILAEIKEDSSNISIETLEALEQFANSVIENQSSLDNYEVDSYVDEVYKDNQDIDINSYKEELKKLKVIIKGMSLFPDNDNFKLYDNQINFIIKFCEDTLRFVSDKKIEIENSNGLRAEKETFDQILSRMQENKKLSRDDLDKILELIKNMTNRDQMEVLTDFLSYNKHVENVNHNDKMVAEKIEELKAKAKDFEFRDKKDVNYFGNAVDDYEEEVRENINLNGVMDIINFFKEKGIFDNFEDLEVLLAILVYGTKESVEEAYDEFFSHKIPNDYRTWVDLKVVYKQPGLWAVQEDIKRKKKSNDDFDSKGGTHTPSKLTLKGKVREMYRKELCAILEVLIGRGLDETKISGYCGLDKYDSVLEQLEVFDKYHVFVLDEANLSTFKAASMAAERCDKAIECGLLNAEADKDDISLKTYANHCTSFISLACINDDTVKILQYLHDIGELETIRVANVTKKTYLSVKSRKLKQEEYASELEDLVETDKKNFDAYEKMYKIIRKNPNNVDFRQDTLNSSFISELDNENNGIKISDYEYSFNDKIISRYKVLRIYQALMNSDQRDQFSEEDIRFFALTYGTYFTEEAYKNIRGYVYNEEKGMGGK